MTIPEFEPWPKIARYNRDIRITEKIDGTCGVVHVLDDGGVLAGSRSQYIGPDGDNFGFAAWVADHDEHLADVLGPGRHYGEWFGHKIQRGYGLDHRRFALFDTSHILNDDDTDIGLTTVPVLHEGPWADPNEYISMLAGSGSIAVPGYNNPEGIVVYHRRANVGFKITIKDDDRGKEWGA